MRLPETSKIQVSFHHEQNVKKSKTDVTEILNFLDYYSEMLLMLKNIPLFFLKKKLLKLKLLISFYCCLCSVHCALN